MHQLTPLSLLVPAGTQIAAPVTKNWTVYPGWLEYILIVIPTGHNALTGIRVTYQGTPVIPFDLTAFLIDSGGRFQVPWRDEVMRSGLQVQAYNTDRYPHTFYLYADIDPYLTTYKGQLAAGGPPAVPSAAAAAAVAAMSARAA